jgi:ankyrin repeat protein
MGYTPLQNSILWRKSDSMYHLLSYSGINVNAKSLQFGRTALIIASESILSPIIVTFNTDKQCTKEIDIISLLLEKGSRVNDRDTDRSWQALHYAAYANNIYAAKLLIHYGADINSIDEYGQTPLMIACPKQSMEIASWLIDQKQTRFDIKDKDHNTVLDIIGEYNDNQDEENKEQSSPSSSSSLSGLIIRKLLNNNINTNS